MLGNEFGPALLENVRNKFIMFGFVSKFVCLFDLGSICCVLLLLLPLNILPLAFALAPAFTLVLLLLETIVGLVDGGIVLDLVCESNRPCPFGLWFIACSALDL